jgi:tryptophanyl-tRNA synthetase
MTQTLLTGIKPTGTPHLGNYAGAIKPTCDLARDPNTQSFLLIADGHALNAMRDPVQLRHHVSEVAATYAAFGLATDRGVLFRQSDISEIFQLSNILACYCAKGMANRAHAYKAAVAKNTEAGKTDSDAGINMGLFTYPLLMSADILAFDTDVVPVGSDQRQHVELTISLARSINSAVGQALRVPTLRIDEATQAVPGLDGRKMSKSYKNTIPLFCSREVLQKRIGRVRTTSRAPGVPGDPTSCSLFALYNIFSSDLQREALRREYELGTGYAKIKEEVFELCDASLREPRARYLAYMDDREALATTLSEGAERAREAVRPVLARVRKAVGLS